VSRAHAAFHLREQSRLFSGHIRGRDVLSLHSPQTDASARRNHHQNIANASFQQQTGIRPMSSAFHRSPPLHHRFTIA